MGPGSALVSPRKRFGGSDVPSEGIPVRVRISGPGRRARSTWEGSGRGRHVTPVLFRVVRPTAPKAAVSPCRPLVLFSCPGARVAAPPSSGRGAGVAPGLHDGIRRDSQRFRDKGNHWPLRPFYRRDPHRLRHRRGVGRLPRLCRLRHLDSARDSADDGPDLRLSFGPAAARNLRDAARDLLGPGRRLGWRKVPGTRADDDGANDATDSLGRLPTARDRHVDDLDPDAARRAGALRDGADDGRERRANRPGHGRAAGGLRTLLDADREHVDDPDRHLDTPRRERGVDLLRDARDATRDELGKRRHAALSTSTRRRDRVRCGPLVGPGARVCGGV